MATDMSKAIMTPDGWRREKQGNHIYRPKWVDFQGRAIHQLTLVTTGRKPSLGSLVIPNNDPEKAYIKRTPIGQMVAEEIERIPTYKDASNIEIYRYVIMPDHIHILLHVHERLPKHLGQYVRWFKHQCTTGSQLFAAIPANNPASDCSLLGAIPPSNHPTDRCSLLAATPASSCTLFAPEYHTRTLSGRNQLSHMAHYIDDNPKRLAIKRLNPDLFRIKQNYHFGNIPCVVLGNIFLANDPQRAVLQCSRKLTQEQIDTLREECLAEAANGTVYISGAISEGEKQICRALREAGFPLIIIMVEGFPEPDSPHYKYFKPQGVYFKACAAAKLLLVQPDKELLERPDIVERVSLKVGNIPHDSQRYRFVAMNVIAEDIANSAE